MAYEIAKVPDPKATYEMTVGVGGVIDVTDDELEHHLGQLLGLSSDYPINDNVKLVKVLEGAELYDVDAYSGKLTCKAPGTAVAVLKVVGDANHEDMTVTVTITSTGPAKQTIEAKDITVAYGETGTIEVVRELVRQ